MFDITKLASVPGVVAVATCDALQLEVAVGKFTHGELDAQFAAAFSGCMHAGNEPFLNAHFGFLLQRLH